MQRSKKLLKEIEMLPNERDLEFLTDDNSEFGSGRLPNKYSSVKNGYSNVYPTMVVLCPEQEIICGDFCSKPAIRFGKKN